MKNSGVEQGLGTLLVRLIIYNMKRDTVLAAGAGFVASHLCDALIRDGHEVVCVDIFLLGGGG